MPDELLMLKVIRIIFGLIMLGGAIAYSQGTGFMGHSAEEYRQLVDDAKEHGAATARGLFGKD